MTVYENGVADPVVLGDGNRTVAPGGRTGVILGRAEEDDSAGHTAFDRAGIVGFGEELVVALLPAVVPGLTDLLEIDAFGGFSDDGEFDVQRIPSELVMVEPITAGVDRVVSAPS